jgi:ribosome-binding protein aMBF1 (putative translation factor)
MNNVETALRQAIADSGLTAYALAKRAGVDVAIVTRFMRGQRSIRIEAVSKLADALGLELAPKDHARTT